MKKFFFSLFGFDKRVERNAGEDKRVLNMVASPDDPRDKLFSIKNLPSLFGIEALPEKYSLEKYCPPVKQQGSIGSCGSHAIASAVEMLDCMRDGDVLPLSELFHYYVVRGPDYMCTLPKDSGQYLRDGIKVAYNVGVAPEKLCPYDVSKFNEQPSLFAYSFAKWSRIKEYNRCDDAQDFKEALVNNRPVVFALRIYDGFQCADPITGDVSRDGAYRGGHAILAVGYDDAHTNPDGSTGAVRFLNSWGVGWGHRGYGWVSYNLLESSLIEAWAVS